MPHVRGNSWSSTPGTIDSFRVPRPDLTWTTPAPIAIPDKSAEWAASAIEKWYGPERKGYQAFGPAFHAAWSGRPGCRRAAGRRRGKQGQPAFVRASALEEFDAHPSVRTANAVREGLSDPDPLVRSPHSITWKTATGEQLWPLVAPLLDDPVRGVRIESGVPARGRPAETLSAADLERLEKAEREFVAAQMLKSADGSESQSLLARYYIRKGAPDKAEAAYKTALGLQSAFHAGSGQSGRFLCRQQGRDDRGHRCLARSHSALARTTRACITFPGLALVRAKKQEEGVAALGARPSYSRTASAMSMCTP